MASYTGYEFDPASNRLKDEYNFLALDPNVKHPPVDPQNPYKTPYTGFIDKTVDCGGQALPYTAYIPEGFPPYTDGIYLFLPGGAEPKAYFEQSGFAAVSQEHCIAIVLLQPAAASWRDWELETALAYARAVFRDTNKREHYGINECAFYAAGFADGAYMAGVFSLLYSSVFAGFAACGDTSLDPQLLEKIGALPSDGDPATPKSRVPLCAWLLDDNAPLLNYLLTANNAKTAGRNEAAAVYRQRPNATENLVNEQSVCEVWHTPAAKAAALSPGEALDGMARFLKRFKRYAAIGNRCYHANQTPEDAGLAAREIIVEGRRRRYRVFVPDAYRKNPGKKYPLVFGFHGVCCSGEYFAQNSEWHRVGQARDFFVVYPTAYPKPYGGMAPTPAWGGYSFREEGDPDDVAFVLAVLEEMKTAYPIDETRVYAAGHSNGSAMTQMLIRQAPQTFAAFAPVGYMDGEVGGAPPDPIGHETVCPTWFMKGENDIGGGKLEAGSANLAMVQNLCAVNGTDYDTAARYQSGPYLHLVARDGTGYPLVRFSEVLGLPHAYTPEMSYLIWDEFFCKYTRGTDGAVRYLG